MAVGAGRIAATGFVAALTLGGSAWAAPASRLLDDTLLLLAPGERVVVRLAPDGRLSEFSAGPAPPGDGPDAPAGFISLTLKYSAGTTLKVQNRTDKAFDYEVSLLSGLSPSARGQVTNVCTVRAGLLSFENWPGQPVPALLVGRFQPKEGPETGCPMPATPLRAPKH